MKYDLNTKGKEDWEDKKIKALFLPDQFHRWARFPSRTSPDRRLSWPLGGHLRGDLVGVSSGPGVPPCRHSTRPFLRGEGGTGRRWSPLTGSPRPHGRWTPPDVPRSSSCWKSMTQCIMAMLTCLLKQGQARGIWTYHSKKGPSF